jgi:glycosyltransferase involved in cell wall biosynthesis
MSTALTIALCLRNDEARLPDMARSAVELATRLADEHAAGEWHDATHLEGLDDEGLDAGELEFELLALDEGSRDNSLSVLSILHAKIPELITVSDLPRGGAIMRAARTASGRVWLIADAPFEVDRALWATRQVFRGDRAALVPGELLAVERRLGQATLGWLRGGLASAQHEVERMLAAQGQQGAWSPAGDWGVRERARHFVRGRLAQLGLGRLDRPK